MTPRRLATLIALVGLVSASLTVPVRPQVNPGTPIIIWTMAAPLPDIDWGPGPKFHPTEAAIDVPAGMVVDPILT